jgi:GTP-binding protein
MFIDEVEITVKGGNGGDGCTAFLREKYKPKGGPAGGDGGDGGSVYAEPAPGLRTLIDFRSRRTIKAANGKPGEGKNCTGRSGDDVVIKVPIGTIIRDRETAEIIADMKKRGQQSLLAKGGSGGRGNARFATSTNRAPTKHEKGRQGEVKRLTLDLRVLANAGTVGPPNAGKSTLIGAISTARPRVADYPFTTLVPSVGLVKVGDYSSFTIADIPGLMEFAHKGKGLGHAFLRHLGRTKVLVHLIPLSGADEGTEIDGAVKNFKMIENELKAYGHGLTSKPRIDVISKADLAINEDVINRVAESIREESGRDSPPLAISSHTGRGLKELVERIYDYVKEDIDRWPESYIADILFDERDL